MERRAEVTSIFNNRKTVIKGIEARNELLRMISGISDLGGIKTDQSGV